MNSERIIDALELVGDSYKQEALELMNYRHERKARPKKFAKILIVAAIIASLFTVTAYAGVKIINSPEGAKKVARTAVPVFFMISGYFYSSVVEKSRQTKQILKIFTLALLSSGLYFFWDTIVAFIYYDPPLELSVLPSFTYVRLHYLVFQMPDLWKNLLVFNEPVLGLHLWYVFALLYVFIIAWLLDRFSDRKKFYFLIPILIAVFLFLSNYSKVLLGWSPLDMVYRNFLTMGLPFFLLGDYLYGHDRRHQISTKGVCVALLISFAVVYAEYALLMSVDSSIEYELYIGTSVAASALIILAERDLSIYNNRIVQTLSAWGKRYSLGIYVLHILILYAIDHISPVLTARISCPNLHDILSHPICVMIIAMCIVVPYDKLKRLIKIKKA